MVIPAVVYDALVAGSDNLDVSVVQWTGTNVATPATAGYPAVTNKVGTGTGELDLTSGVIKANLVQILGTALTETAGYLSAAFKKFFNVATPTGTVNSIPDAVAGADNGLAIKGTVMGKSPATLAAGDVSGNLSADVVNWKGATAPAMTGDAFARLGAAGAGLTALGDTRIGNLDTTVSSRAPEALGNVAAIKADVEHATYGLNALLTAIGTRMATFTYTAPDSASTIATAVWANATRTLSSFGSLVADIATAVWGAVTRSLTDKAGFTISGTKQTLDILHDATQGATKTELDATQLAVTNAITALHNATQGATAGELTTAQGVITSAITALHNLSTGDIDARLAAYDPPTRTEATADKAEIESLVAKVRKAQTNRLVVDPATGAFTIYDDNGTTPLITGTISGTGRSAPTWP